MIDRTDVGSTDTGFWKDVLDTWRVMQGRYITALQNHARDGKREDLDVPWWYGERTSVGFLAAAIWEVGGVALIEHPTEKFGPVDDAVEHAVHFKGWCDLYGLRGDDEVFVEAKQPGFEECAHDFAGVTKRALEDAVAAAQYHRPERGKCYGIAFIAPRISQRAAKDGSLQQILDTWLAAYEATPCEAKACYFPTELQAAFDGSHYYPGVAVFVKLAKEMKSV